VVGDFEHGAVVGLDLGEDAADAAGAGVGQQVADQAGAQPLALPRVLDQHGEFGGGRVPERHQVGDRDHGPIPPFLRDKRRPAGRIDQPVPLGGRQPPPPTVVAQRA
jgi:hypothetical protein